MIGGKDIIGGQCLQGLGCPLLKKEWIAAFSVACDAGWRIVPLGNHDRWHSISIGSNRIVGIVHVDCPVINMLDTVGGKCITSAGVFMPGDKIRLWLCIMNKIGDIGRILLKVHWASKPGVRSEWFERWKESIPHSRIGARVHPRI